jgi:hypothetical protein
MQTKFIGPYSYHAPAIKEQNGNGDSIEYVFGAQFVPLLDVPV